MRCCHCGKRIPDTTEICPYCGHLQLEFEVKQANRRRTRTALLVVLAVLLLLGGIAFYLLYGSTILNPPAPTPDPLDGLIISVTPRPTAAPTEEPAAESTEEPAEAPTAESTEEPAEAPTAEPTEEPAEEPTAEPTEEPAEAPTTETTEAPTVEPTAEPTAAPTAEPTVEPTAAPTADPTVEPTAEPAAEPTVEPTPVPTPEPTPEPTERPHPGEHDLAGMRRPLVFPQSESWLSEYETVYVRSDGNASAIFLLNSPTNLNFVYGLVFKDLPQTALARENGHTLLRTNDGRLGWVKSYLLSEGTPLYGEPEPTSAVPEVNAAPETTAVPELPDNTVIPAVENVEATAAPEETAGIGNALSSALGNVFSNVADALAPTYIADIGHAVFHKLDCAKVDEIATVNRWENTKTRDELLRLGYEPCPVCNP